MVKTGIEKVSLRWIGVLSVMILLNSQLYVFTKEHNRTFAESTKKTCYAHFLSIYFITYIHLPLGNTALYPDSPGVADCCSGEVLCTRSRLQYE